MLSEENRQVQFRLLRAVEARWPRSSGPGPSPGRGTVLPLSTQVYKLNAGGNSAID